MQSPGLAWLLLEGLAGFQSLASDPEDKAELARQVQRGRVIPAEGGSWFRALESLMGVWCVLGKMGDVRAKEGKPGEASS